MTAPDLPDFVLAGTTKAASTWIYECIEDHPEIATHDGDTVHYFNVNYHRGRDWYADQFDPDADQVVGETSPSYMYSEGAMERLATELPDVDLLFCLRNPVDRAFSHWWHGYSDGLWSYEFEAALDDYPPFDLWVEPGYYARHLETVDEHFDRDQVQVWLFDDLVADNAQFVADVFDTVGVDPTYVPAALGDTSNEARTEAPDAYKAAVRWMRTNAPDRLNATLRPLWEQVRWFVEDRSKYEQGIDPEVRAELERVYVDDVRALSSRLDRDLDHWFEHVEL